MIVYSQNYVVSPLSATPTLPELNNPIVGWRNVALGSTLEADTEQDGFPVSNLTTPVTYQRWRGTLDGGLQYITFTAAQIEPVDYLAVAGHNFSSGGFTVAVEGAMYLDSDGSPDWVQIAPEVQLTDDGPVLFRFELANYAFLRLVIIGGAADPYAAVMFIGRLLTLPRRIYVGHAPITLNRKSDTLNGRGETGQFLGRIVRRQSNETGIDIKNIDPGFYRVHMRPWVEAIETRTFFFAWRPYTYAREVGYCWGMGDGTPSNEKANGTMRFALSMQGLVQ